MTITMSKVLEGIYHHILFSIAIVIAAIGIALNVTYLSTMGILSELLMIAGIVLIVTAEYLGARTEESNKDRLLNCSTIFVIGGVLCGLGIFSLMFAFRPLIIYYLASLKAHSPIPIWPQLS